MPAPSWFQKLRRRRKKKKQLSPCAGQGALADHGVAARTSAPSPANNNCSSGRRQCQPPPPEPAAACAVSPNRASYYFATAERARGQDDEGAGRRLPRVIVSRRDDDALDVRVDVVHRRAGRLGGLDAPPGTPELKLRPIITARPHDAADDMSVSSATTTTSAATTPSTRARGFHVKRRRRRRDHHRDGGSARMKDCHHHHEKAETAVASEAGEEAAESEASRRQHQQHGGTRRRRWLYESLVVVKASSEPEQELAESMAEMVAANGIRASEDLEELLACYLALNAAEHHRAVVAAFRRVWFHLARHHLV